MADQGFNKIFVVIAMCLYIQLVGVLLQANADSAGDKVYFEMNKAGDLAVRMNYVGGIFLHITVFYDAQSDSAKDFFGKQITSGLLKSAQGCQNIALRLCPCSILKDDNTPKEADMIQICVWKALAQQGLDLNLLGDFIMCDFAGKQIHDCLNQIKVDANTVNHCVAGELGSDSCSDFNTNFQQAKQTKGEPFKAIEEFRGALCMVLSTGSLKCPSICR